VKKTVSLIVFAFLVISTGLFLLLSRQQQELRSRAAAGETQLTVYVTAYTYYDNTPPGSAAISNPVIHQKAGGIGTYTDPITLAVGHSIVNGQHFMDYPAGTKFYIPNVRRYFIVEDTCGDGNTPQNGPCHTGYPSNASAWIDMWIDGQSGTASSSTSCANKVTGVFLVVKDPAPNYAVVPGAVFSNGSCTQLYGNTLVTTSAPTATPTRTPTPTATRTPTPSPTRTPTPTPPAASSRLQLSLFLHGIGKGGDNVNPQGLGNTNPLHTQRNVTVEVYNTQNQLVLTKQGTVTYSASAGNFGGQIDMGKTLPSGFYTLKVKINSFLRTLVPGILTLTAGQLHTVPVVYLTAGDSNGDNSLNVLDYEIILGCYSDFLPPVSCTALQKSQADLTDDNQVNQLDYNLFIRELTNRQGG
jgi:hypothetical protein